jgi:hypothetical protein
MEQEPILNAHNKEEYPPMHTAEHILNQTMVRMFGCPRSRNAHIERKKSQITYILDHKPDRKEERAIERTMNELIDEDMPVTFEFVSRAELEGIIMEADEDSPDARISLDRLPDELTEYYKGTNLMIIFPDQYGTSPDILTFASMQHKEQLSAYQELRNWWEKKRKTGFLKHKEQ